MDLIGGYGCGGVGTNVRNVCSPLLPVLCRNTASVTACLLQGCRGEPKLLLAVGPGLHLGRGLCRPRGAWDVRSRPSPGVHLAGRASLQQTFLSPPRAGRCRGLRSPGRQGGQRGGHAALPRWGRCLAHRAECRASQHRHESACLHALTSLPSRPLQLRRRGSCDTTCRRR